MKKIAFVPLEEAEDVAAPPVCPCSKPSGACDTCSQSVEYDARLVMLAAIGKAKGNYPITRIRKKEVSQ